MASVVASMINPDIETIQGHLEALFAPAREEYPKGLIELRYGQTSPNISAYFNIRPEGIAEAAQFAANRNREGCNIYVGANPRKGSMALKGSASDSDVEIAFYHFADIDNADAVDAAGRRLKALAPTMSVMTGTEPNRRPHFYWLLDEPTRNMAAWTERQRGIAHSLDGDAVINPSRIMRLAGTVNFPPQHKLQRGYKVELTSLRTKFADERGPVSADQIGMAYPVRDMPSQGVTQPTQGQTTLSAMAIRTHVSDLLEACRSGNQWHNNMIRLVAHLAATGRTTAEIIALADHITLPGYQVETTRREMATALQGARTKWAIPEPEEQVVESEERTREEADSIFELLDLDELENMPPPSWLIHEMLPDEGLAIIYGDPGAGKSFVALDMALRLSMAMDWHGVGAKSAGVLYIAGEGARGLGKRVKGWRQKHDMEGVDAPFLLLPVAVQFLDAKDRAKLIRTIDAAIERAGFPIGLIVIDTVSRALAGADENGQDSMGTFVAACDEVRTHAHCTVLGVHHSGKDKDRGMRGSTVLLGACDVSIRLTKSEKIVTLKTEKQKDAEEAEPIYMEMEKVTWATGLGQEESTLVPFRSEAKAEIDKQDIGRDQIVKAFGIIADAWDKGHPLSNQPRAAASGRYASRILSTRLGGEPSQWDQLITSWLENDCLAVEVVDKKTKAKGLKVLEPVT
jgi:hypothetical protein